MQKARGHTGVNSIVLPLLVGKRFQVLFHSGPPVLFTFPSRYWFTIGHRLVFSLGRWSSQIPTGFLVSRGTRVSCKKIHTFRVPDYHRLWSAFPCRSAIYELCNFPRTLQCPYARSHNPSYATRAGLHIQGLGCSRFARRYYENRFYFLFLKVLRCFSSPRSPRTPMYSVHDIPLLNGMGCPIRKSPDQSLLAAPRSLSQLSASFFAYRCQGIRRSPLVA